MHTANHVLNLGRGQLSDSIRNGNVCGPARRLLGGGNLENTINIDLEDALEDGLAGPHRRNWSKSEFSKGSVVLAVDTLALEDRELNLEKSLAKDEAMESTKGGRTVCC